MRRADNLTTFVCRLSWNLGASTSWNPQGLTRPVMGLLYLYYYTYKSLGTTSELYSASRLTWSQHSTLDSQILGTTVQKFTRSCDFWNSAYQTNRILQIGSNRFTKTVPQDTVVKIYVTIVCVTSVEFLTLLQLLILQIPAIRSSWIWSDSSEICQEVTWNYTTTNSFHPFSNRFSPVHHSTLYSPRYCQRHLEHLNK